MRGNKVKSQPFGRGYQAPEIVILEDDGDILSSTHKKSSSRKTIEIFHRSNNFRFANRFFSFVIARTNLFNGQTNSQR